MTSTEQAGVLRPRGKLVVVAPHALGYVVRLSWVGRRLRPESFVPKSMHLREFRSPEDIFPTFYPANAQEDLLRQMEGARLAEEGSQMLRDPAVFNFIAPMAVLKLLVMGILARLGFGNLVEGTMIRLYRRSPVQVTCFGHSVRSQSGRPVNREVGLQ